MGLLRNQNIDDLSYFLQISITCPTFEKDERKGDMSPDLN